MLGVALETTYKIVKGDREKHAKDFYEANGQARLERAHYAFDKLYLEGLRVKNATAGDRQKWAKELVTLLRQYCHEDGSSIYLTNTGRFEPRNASNPLPDDKFPYPLDFVEARLKGDFSPFLK